MGGVCRDPEGQYFVWSSPFSLTTQACLVYSSNPTGDVTINDIELGALLMTMLLFVPRISPLAHIHTYVNKTESQGWANRGSVSTASSVGPILWGLSLAARRQHIHASVGRIPGDNSNMADAALRLTHLPDRKFLSHFPTNFP